MAAITGIAVQVFTASSGTYTPTEFMQSAFAILQGGGAGGITAAATDESGGGGGEGGRSIELLAAATIGASKPFAVGQSAATDTNGNATTLDTAGAIANAPGGSVGAATGASTILGVSAAGGAGGLGTNGDLNVQGQRGFRGTQFSTSDGHGGDGGGQARGAGGLSNTAGGNAGAYGSGGAGGHASGSPNRAGGTGSAGVIFLLEFLADPNITLAITGLSATGAVGTLGVVHEQPVTGEFATGAVGTVTASQISSLAPVSFNNYLFPRVGNGMGTGERIR
jgi:hypothetical protein